MFQESVRGSILGSDKYLAFPLDLRCSHNPAAKQAHVMSRKYSSANYSVNNITKSLVKEGSPSRGQKSHARIAMLLETPKCSLNLMRDGLIEVKQLYPVTM